MADVEFTDPDGDEPDESDPEEDTEEDEPETIEGVAVPQPAGRQFVDLPEGHLTLVGFSRLLEKAPPEGRNVKVRSQVLYSTAKNTKSFPVKSHTDGRQIVDVEEALKWWDEKEARKAERAAAAVAAPAAEETATA
jgi:hypothetical protein